MRIIVHPHALIHEITEKQIESAYETAIGAAVIRERDLDSEPQRWALVGFDNELREIELVFVSLDVDCILVIHANYVTTGFKNEIGSVMK